VFDQIVALIAQYPYVSVATLFVLCGLGLPLPEEIILLAAGYVCAKFPEHAELPLMMAWSAGAILTGDLLPYLLGRIFGVRLLRLRWLRYVVTRQRLARFDRWFRRRGDWVVFIARFIPGIRVVAFFTGGTMKMPWQRFLFLDALGIAMSVPLLSWLGFHSAAMIEEVIATVKKVERGILWTALGGGATVALVWWLRTRSRQRLLRLTRPTEAIVRPQRANGDDAPPTAGEPPLAP
jgi:membrane protein DedA with SNARE-associated domain